MQTNFGDKKHIVVLIIFVVIVKPEIYLKKIIDLYNCSLICLFEDEFLNSFMVYSKNTGILIKTIIYRFLSLTPHNANNNFHTLHLNITTAANNK